MPSRSTSLRLPALRVFIVFPLLPCCLPGAEDANSLASLNEADDKQPLSRGMPHDDLSSLRGGMVWIVEDARKTVAKDRQCLLERHAMVIAVGGSLPRVPLEPDVYWMGRDLL